MKLGFEFTAIDFETANHHRGSPCAVGLAKVRGDVIVDETTWLMQPPLEHGWFEPYNTGIHGISAARVAGQPTFERRLPDILSFIGTDIVCAHNARFDGAVLAAASVAVGAEPPPVRYLCTLTAARRCLELPSYRLPFVADALGVELGDHHEPGSDARAVALLVPLLAAELSVTDLERMVEITQSAPHPRRLPSTDRPHPDASQDHPLWGRVIVFTGALSSMTRHLAHEECIRVGGLPEKTVTKRTNVLVIGDLDPARLVPGDTTSQKAQKAFKLRAAGQDIEVMTEYDFLQSV
jgi:DNA polymerase-3 subunit epsilon